MRILVTPCDRQGCGRYRLGLPVAALQKQEPSLQIYLSEGLPVRMDARTGKVLGLADGFSGWDVVVVQRPMLDWQVECLRDARRQGIATVVEIDDDFEALHNLTPAWAGTHPRSGTGWNRKWLRVACGEADLVTVTTPALAKRYASHGRVAIIPNYVPERWLTITKKKRGNVVGWTGTVGTHHDDLPVTHGGMSLAIRETHARFRVIGNPQWVKRDLALDEEPENVPWQNWDLYPHEVARLDVGIAPLNDTAFNRAKSSLKPLEMAACGVPCVMSPLPSYLDLHAKGIGVLAGERSREWRREVKLLLSDATRRAELAQKGREVASGLTIEKNAHRWAEAWARARRKR